MSEPDVPTVTIHPGESRLVRGRTLFKTLLGSCLGITFRVSRLELGAMCHPMLPLAPDIEAEHPTGNQRFVDVALRSMIRKLTKQGARRDEIEVKLFGCCDVLDFDNGRVTVGSMNARTALRVLAEEGVLPVTQETGGPCGVVILFDSGTGEVLLRRLPRFREESTQLRAGKHVR